MKHLDPSPQNHAILAAIAGMSISWTAAPDAQQFLECDPTVQSKALRLDGNDDYVRIAYDPSFPVFQLTATAWINTSDVDSGASILAYGEDDSSDKKPWEMNLTEGNLTFSMENPGDQSLNYASGFHVADGAWHHVAVTRGVDGRVEFFVDGVLVSSQASLGDPSPDSTQDMTIGCLLGSSGGGLPQLPLKHFEGLIGEITLWSRALGPSEIGSVYQSHVDTSSPDLVAWWRFREGGGQIVRDYALNQTSGVLGEADLVADDDPARVVGVFCPLSAAGTDLSVSQGGVQAFSLDAGAEHGIDLYLLLGSMSGTNPGVSLGRTSLPLNPDGYFLHTLQFPNWPPFTSSLGILQFDGAGESQFTLPAGMDASLAGLELHHAYVVIDLFGSGAITFASNAVPLTLVP